MGAVTEKVSKRMKFVMVRVLVPLTSVTVRVTS